MDVASRKMSARKAQESGVGHCVIPYPWCRCLSAFSDTAGMASAKPHAVHCPQDQERHSHEETSLKQLFGTRTEPKEEDAPITVIDLFCGCGGFTTGAVMAGCSVSFVCDSDFEALQCHKDNHPQCTHSNAPLPMDIDFPTNCRFHLHGSPPCQKFSSAGTRNRHEGDRERPGHLINWFLETAISCGAHSWSMEQVANPKVIDIINEVRSKNTSLISYAVINFKDLGVPQSRKRVICGPPWLVAELVRHCSHSRRKTVQDVLTCRGTFIRDGSYHVGKRHGKAFIGNTGPRYFKASWTEHCKPVTQQSHTVLANRLLSWVWKEGGRSKHVCLNTQEMATLQTFPKTYEWPVSKGLCMSLIGKTASPCSNGDHANK